MGSATIQGQLWGTRAQDWATYVEEVCLPLFGAVLDAAPAAGRFPTAPGSLVRTRSVSWLRVSVGAVF
jgi:hypothetical protein